MIKITKKQLKTINELSNKCLESENKIKRLKEAIRRKMKNVDFSKKNWDREVANIFNKNVKDVKPFIKKNFPIIYKRSKNVTH